MLIAFILTITAGNIIPHKANYKTDTLDKKFTYGKILLTHKVNSKKSIYYTTLMTQSPIH